MRTEISCILERAPNVKSTDSVYLCRNEMCGYDDGVKVNYGKFGDLLAEVKAVTGGAGAE